MRSLAALLFALSMLVAVPPLLTVSPLAGQDAMQVEGYATQTLSASGLEQPVEILRDRWGINHIYAQNQADLFFAQGYAAARDRMFQFEVWRRQSTGTVSEILGPEELERDRGHRLFMFRGDMQQEMEHYHPDGVEIITSYVRGVNAWISETRRRPDLLPLEFELLGIEPQEWTPEIVISRHQGLLGNIGQELNNGRAVHAIGADKLRDLVRFHPAREGQPQLDMDPSIDASLLSDDILGVYNAFRAPVRFRPEHIVDPARRNRASQQDADNFLALSSEQEAAWKLTMDREHTDIGSNNWVVSGDRTLTGYPFMANDPHRRQSVPSLRYWAHLVAPGWDVIGGGEPEIPGISIGHNGVGAWGLTVFGTDGEDLYVYDINPANENEYWYLGRWEAMRTIVDTIPVKGQAAEIVTLKYTRHGPVVFEDSDNNVAYAVRAGWLEVGGAPYLASLRMDQSKTWEEFVEASNYSHIPGENMIWADRKGTIGWQAVGIAPIRQQWSGLTPVPGDGRYEWSGYLPIKAKPHVVNPDNGYFGTANSNLVAPDFEFRDEAIGWVWSDPSRWARVNEVLGSGRRLSMMDMISLQVDYESVPARTLVPLLRQVRSSDRNVERARQMLLDWADSRTPTPPFQLRAESVEAGLYVAYERRVESNMHETMVPEAGRPFVRSVPMKRITDWLLAPGREIGAWADGDPMAGRRAIVLRSLEEAVGQMRQDFGSDMDGWTYGQDGYKHVTIRHPLSAAVDSGTRAMLDAGPLPRGGSGYTVGSTGGGNNQVSGASFRIIVDTEDWDNTVGANTPGQSGDPASPFYKNLFDLWGTDQFFPVFYSRDKVEAVTAERLMLSPGG
jgi:penicillin amidase